MNSGPISSGRSSRKRRRRTIRGAVSAMAVIAATPHAAGLGASPLVVEIAQLALAHGEGVPLAGADAVGGGHARAAWRSQPAWPSCPRARRRGCARSRGTPCARRGTAFPASGAAVQQFLAAGRCSGRKPSEPPSRSTRFMGGVPRKVATKVVGRIVVDLGGRPDLARSCRGRSRRCDRPCPWPRPGRGSRRSWSCRTVCWNCLSSLRAQVRSLASRLDSGSSSRKTVGSRTSARASATRWRSPPESWRGLRCGELIDARAAASRPVDLALDLVLAGVRWVRSGKAMLLRTLQMRVEAVALEHHGDAAGRAAARR